MNATATVNKAKELSKEAAEKAEKVIQDVNEQVEETIEAVKAKPAFKKVRNLVRKSVHLSLGAIALVREQIETTTERCIERGEIVEKDTKAYAKKIFDEILTTTRLKKAEIKAQDETVEDAENTEDKTVEAKDAADASNTTEDAVKA